MNIEREEGLDPTIVYALCGVREYVPLLSGVQSERRDLTPPGLRCAAGGSMSPSSQVYMVSEF